MDLNYTPAENRFREEVRTFIHDKLPGDLAQKVLHHKRLLKDDYLRWQNALSARGWMAPGWPVKFGGPGWSPIERYIFEEECAAAGAPQVSAFGINMIGPVLMAYGSPWQQSYYLPRILSNEHWWCQGYSEPGAGSDLAALKTRAELQGDHYIVNGQKTWNTLGQWADWCFCLVRTSSSGKKQEGISCMLIDMHAPGVTVRPIMLLDGEEEVNEIFFSDVIVPAENLVGDEGRGWSIAKYLLGHERTGIAGVGRSKRELRYLKYIASQEQLNNRPLLEDAVFSQRVAQVEIDLLALEITCLRVAAAEGEGKGPGPEASILKIKGTEIQQALTELMMDAVGPNALPFLPLSWGDNWIGERVGPEYAAPLAARYLNGRKTTIYGGSNEIQKNIISQMVLGL